MRTGQVKYRVPACAVASGRREVALVGQVAFTKHMHLRAADLRYRSRFKLEAQSFVVLAIEL